MSRAFTARRRSPRAGWIVAGALLVGCVDGPAGPPARDAPIDLATTWEIADPVAAGFDQGRLDAASAFARTLPNLSSFLVVRHGRLVVEEYFGTGPDEMLDVRSVTKSVVSTLVGVAVREELLPGIDVPIGDYLGPDIIPIGDPRANITVRHLLTMSSGFAWDETTADGYNEWIRSDDHLQFLMDRALVDAPGTAFTYNSAAVHLLGATLAQATGMPLDVFADRYLFEPLGVTTREWEIISQGLPNGGSGLDLRARDLARLGQLWLQRGWSGSRMLLDDRLIDEATTAQFPWTTTAGPLGHVSYGYLWWVDSDPDGPAFFAWGFGGQFVFVLPGHDLVVVVTQRWRGVGSAVSGQAAQGLELIDGYVVPSVVR